MKRDGVELMNARSKNVSLAKETLKILEAKRYTAPSGKVVNLAPLLDSAIEGTVLYKPEDDTQLDGDRLAISPTIEVTNETTAQAAARLIASGKDVVALNFASARNQGGGFLAGAVAQEEDLCRASGLYHCLKRKPIFYNANILCGDIYYTHHLIYSPKVPFFRAPDNSFLEEPFTASIISAPAPNLNGVQKVDTDKLMESLAERVIRILQVAELHGHETLILGAWGCGAFGNDPRMVAAMFEAGLLLVPAFSHVCFAVYDTRQPPTVYQTFREVFA